MRKGHFSFRIRNDGTLAAIHAVPWSRRTLCGMALQVRFTFVGDSEPVTCRQCLAQLARKQTS